MQFKPTRFAVLLAGFVASFGAIAQQTTNIGTVTVQGTDSTSSGEITAEETPKARSSVNQDYIKNLTPTSNPYQAIAQLPGVATFSYDATGLFGGALRVRGFNSDQMGFTINGAPVNDSGSFTVFPQEYSDAENLCDVFVTQGSTDTNAPHVGASGGNVGLVSCAPSDQRRIKVEQTTGSLNMYKTFVRLDTGLIGKSKTYVSYSKAMADKFKGDGRADRQHVDFGTEYDLTSASKLSATLLYNRAVNNNYGALTLAQYRADPYQDFSTAVPRHLAPGAGAQNEAALNQPVFYGLSLNPFENAIATADANLKLADGLQFDLAPYFWYGFGTGGNQQTTLGESSLGLNNGIADLNGDGDRADTILIYRSSVTRTFRPGVTSSLTWSLPNNTVVLGGWFERAHHRQTQPGSKLYGDGLNADKVSDKWLDNPDAWINYTNGQVYEGRNWFTISTGYSAFLTDTISLLRDKLTIVPGVRYSGIDRDFTNYANSGTAGTTLGVPSAYNSFATYEVKKNYDEVLPSLGIRYALTDTQSVYANATKNFRVPSNFVYSNLLRSNVVANGVYTNQFVNGQYVNYSQRAVPVDKETSWNYEAGYRFATERLTLSTAVFYNDFKNRIAAAFNNDTQTVTDYNVGKSHQYGVEGEAGVKIYGPFSAYASASYLRSEIKQDLQAGGTATAPTTGKQFPDTPNVLSALSLIYQDKFGYFGMVQTKYTGRRQSTLVNDQNIPGYATVDLAGGYTYPGSFAYIQHPFIRFNASNVTNEEYLNLNGPSGSNFTLNANSFQSNGTTVNGTQPTYYVGAPDFFSVTIGAEF